MNFEPLRSAFLFSLWTTAGVLSIVFTIVGIIISVGLLHWWAVLAVPLVFIGGMTATAFCSDRGLNGPDSHG